VRRAEASAGRLALGTAQLGGRYGIANRLGQPSAAQARAIFDVALAAGVRCFDTAAGYGDAELRVGQYLRERGLTGQVGVVTKLGAGDVRDEVSLRAALARSRARLGVVPDGVLLHDPELLGRWRGSLERSLQACVAASELGAVGVSVYHPAQFATALELPGLTIIQAPFSVLDQRLEQAGLLEQAQRLGVSVMLRSVFLQGLLLLEPSRCPASLAFATARLARWRELCARFGLAPAHVALRFALQRAPQARIVVGCESRAQLCELLAAADAPPLPASLIGELEELASADAELLDPTRWRV
jgi:aryl-alcohol dehydrogenase-like predicted oxidoreductase